MIYFIQNLIKTNRKLISVVFYLHIQLYLTESSTNIEYIMIIYNKISKKNVYIECIRKKMLYFNILIFIMICAIILV